VPLTGQLWPLATHHRVRGLTLAIGLRPHWPTLATPIGGAPLHGQRGPHPRLATYRPIGSPPGPMATASLTGHLRATYWPSGEASHWPKGWPRLAT